MSILTGLLAVAFALYFSWKGDVQYAWYSLGIMFISFLIDALERALSRKR